MSQNRLKPDRGWCNPQQRPAGPQGRPLCRNCEQEIPKGSGRRTFCSKACVDDWRIRTDPNFVREKVFERDQGVCAKCCKDTMADLPLRRKKRAPGTGHLWQADHIVPVIEGGGECGLEGYQSRAPETPKGRGRRTALIESWS